MLVIGITGRNCAGKDTVARALAAHGFESHSLSDVLREELRRRGEPITRPALIALGNELREAGGPAVLARRVKDLMRGERVALVSIRNPAEVRELRTLPRFVLIGVDAPVEVRFERERARGRESAPDTLDAFRSLEERENSTDPNAQQLDAVLREADVTLENDGTLDAFDAKVSEFLARISSQVSGDVR